MKTTDTPETDTACGYASAYDKDRGKLRDEVDAEFTRRLERERDEARKYLKWICDVADSQRKWNFRSLAKEGLMKSGDAK